MFAPRVPLALCALSLLGSLATRPSAQAQCLWEALEPSPVDRFEAATTVWNDELYIFGGFDAIALTATTRCDRYDPQTDTWTQLASMPGPLTHAVAARVGDTVYFAGGFLGANPAPVVDEVWAYDLLLDSWTTNALPALPAKRGGGGLLHLNGRLHYIGGYLEDRITNAGEHWVLDLADVGAGWDTQNFAPLPVPRGHFSALEHGGKFYVFGGQVGHDSFTNPQPPFQTIFPVDTDRVEVYDSVTNTWTQLASLPFARSHAEGGTYFDDGHIVVCGGRSSALGVTALEDVSRYSISGDSWDELAVLPEPLLAPVVQPIGDQLVASTGGVTNIVPQERTWTRDLELEIATHIRINCGAGELELDENWCPDSFSNGGNGFVVNVPIAGTDQDALYQSLRSGTALVPDQFAYAVPLPNGAWRVRLHFAELFWSNPGQRVFDVELEQLLVLDEFDLVLEAGAAQTALVRTFDVLVEDGVLDLDFSASTDRPAISAIELELLADGSLQRTCVGAPNSAGPGAQLALVGSTSLGEATLSLELSGLPAGAPGAYLLASSGGSLPFGWGTLCVDPFGFVTGPIQIASGAGTLSTPFPIQSAAFAPGQTYHLQFAYLDASVSALNTSDSLAFTLTP